MTTATRALPSWAPPIDPSRWVDVRASLPLLTQPRWYQKTKHGYARGHEAETYVGNVRTYYDMLVYLFGDAPHQTLPAQDLPPEEAEPSYAALRSYGNMSSPTILFVLKDLRGRLRRGQADGDGVAMAFGPGLVVEMARLHYLPAPADLKSLVGAHAPAELELSV